MARRLRVHEPHQPPLPLGHGLVHWNTLPPTVRERVLTLWLQLLAEHLAHQRVALALPPTGPSDMPREIPPLPEGA